MKKELVIVIDFGGQYNQLVARRVRECNVYCEIYSYKTDIEKIKAMNPKGIILTGGPNSCYEADSPTYKKELFELGIPVLGLCYGAQLMMHVLGGKVESAPVREYGKTEVLVDKKDSKIFEGVSEKTICWMSHFDYSSKTAPGFKITATTADCPVAAAEDVEKNLYAIKGGKQIDDFYTNTLLGVQILSMSKRIMNEVMCTAEDLGINIYYQDTDSMHIQKSRLNDLSNEYFKRFGRELIGKNLGQFHNDFDEVADGYAYQSIFVGKKMYVDLLKNDKGETGVHYRMKGVNLDCVKLYAEEHNCEIFDVYNKLFNGETLTFDLLKAKPCFKMNDNQTVTNQLNFERSIKATSN